MVRLGQAASIYTQLSIWEWLFQFYPHMKRTQHLSSGASSSRLVEVRSSHFSDSFSEGNSKKKNCSWDIPFIYNKVQGHRHAREELVGTIYPSFSSSILFLQMLRKGSWRFRTGQSAVWVWMEVWVMRTLVTLNGCAGAALVELWTWVTSTQQPLRRKPEAVS